MMKTKTQWAELLPEDVKQKFLANMKRDNCSDTANVTLHDAIDSAFPWVASPEGSEYWESVYQEAKKQHQTKTL